MHATLPPCNFKFRAPDDAGTFRGFASTFGGTADQHGDVVAHGAFTRTLAEHKMQGTRPALLWSHDQMQPIGVWSGFNETPDGLEAIGRLTLEVEKAREAHALMKSGALALSIGYRVRPGGYRIEGKNRVLTDLDLFEVSAVAMPANTGARITEVKTAYPDIRTLEVALRDALGLSAREAKRLASGGWSALVREERDDGAETELKAIAEQLTRITHSLRKQA